MKYAIESSQSYKESFIPISSLLVSALMIFIGITRLTITKLQCKRVEAQQVHCERARAFLAIRALESLQPIESNVTDAAVTTNSILNFQTGYNVTLKTQQSTVTLLPYASSNLGDVQRITNSINTFINSDADVMDVETALPIIYAGFFGLQFIAGIALLIISSIDMVTIEPTQQRLIVVRAQLWRLRRNVVAFDNVVWVQVGGKYLGRGFLRYHLRLHLKQGSDIVIGREESRKTAVELKERIDRSIGLSSVGSIATDYMATNYKAYVRTGILLILVMVSVAVAGSVYVYHSIMGDQWARRGNSQLAIDEYSQAINLIPFVGIAYRQRAAQYVGVNDFDQAIADYSQIIRLNPNDSLAYIRRAESWISKGKFEVAILDCTQAISIEVASQEGFDHQRITDLDMAYATRGHAYYLKKDYDHAIADFSNSLSQPRRPTQSLTPTFNQQQSVLWQRGEAYFEKSDLTHAIDDYSGVLRLIVDSNSSSERIRATSIYKRGIAYQLTGQPSQAISDFEQYLKMGNDAVFLADATRRLKQLKPT